ncbi:MAG TPA: hypothetical protein VF717_18835, partial [Pyrinomonadaceae bacterium]
CGLYLKENTDGGFTLGAGAAIDCCGREIVVGSDYTKTDLTDLDGYREEIVTQQQTIYLCLMYDECIREPIRAQANASSCADVCDYNRIREGFKIVIKTTPPAAASDFCEVTSSKKIVFEDARLRLERVAPLWVNPKDVFEVQLIATPKNVSATLVVEAEETFSPAGQLTVVQGISSLTHRVSFSLTQSGGALTKTYLLRAGETIVDAGIKANIFFPLSTQQSAEDQSTTVQVKAERISDLIAAKIFNDEEAGACPSCKEDHCLYLASAKLGEESKLTDVKRFPSDQYVYNNPLLFELLACGEKRIGKLPEIPVSNKTTQVIAAVTAFKFFDGLTVADGGLGQANVTARVDKGLKIDNDAIVADLGNGTMLDGNHISADLGNGLMFDGNHIAARTGQGVKLSGNLIAANLGDGLRLDGADRITANTGSGLNLVAQKLVAEVANGLKITGNQIQPDYSTATQAGKVCEANDPRLSNARTPLPHAPTHQAGGSDQLNVNNLPGILLNAQKVEVQDEGTIISTRTKLNFLGAGVTVTDEAAQNRVNINIPQSGRVSSGLVRFLEVRAGTLRQSEFIDHLQGANPCAIILSLAMEANAETGEKDLFGDIGVLGALPALVAYNSISDKAFKIGVKDRRSREDQQTVTYTVRWWAIPKNLDAPLLVVEAPPDINLATEEAVRFNLAVNPGIKREDLAGTLGIEASEVDTHINNLRTAGKINVVGNRIFLK